jgi:hypothetical protein
LGVAIQGLSFGAEMPPVLTTKPFSSSVIRFTSTRQKAQASPADDHFSVHHNKHPLAIFQAKG